MSGTKNFYLILHNASEIQLCYSIIYTLSKSTNLKIMEPVCVLDHSLLLIRLSILIKVSRNNDSLVCFHLPSAIRNVPGHD